MRDRMALACRLPVIPFGVDKGWSWVITASVLLWNVVVGGSLKISGMLFVEYLDLFGKGPTTTSWINSTLGIMMVIMSPVGGYMTDKISHNKMRLVMLGLFTLAALCVALAGFMPTLALTILVYGALLGGCAGLVDPATLSLPSRYFKKKMTTAYGVAFMGNSIGTMLLPFLFTISTERFGFRGAMLIFAGVWMQCLLIPANAWSLRIYSKTNSLQNTLSGSNVEDLKMEMEISNDVNAINTKQAAPNKTKEEPLSNGVQIKCSKPKRNCCTQLSTLAKELVKPDVLFLVLSLFCGTFGYFNSFFVLPPLAKELHISKLETSCIMFITSILELVSKVTIGQMVDRWKVPKGLILSVGFAVTGCVGTILSCLSYGRLLYLYGIILGVLGGVAAGLGIPMMIDSLGISKRGLASGLYTFISGLASAVGPVILGSISEASGSFRYALLTCGLVYLLGIVSYFGGRISTKMKKLCLHRESV